jgi:hypothetical protein
MQPANRYNLEIIVDVQPSVNSASNNRVAYINKMISNFGIDNC